MEALIRTIRWVKLIYRDAHENDKEGIYNAKNAYKYERVGLYKRMALI